MFTPYVDVPFRDARYHSEPRRHPANVVSLLSARPSSSFLQPRKIPSAKFLPNSTNAHSIFGRSKPLHSTYYRPRLEAKSTPWYIYMFRAFLNLLPSSSAAKTELGEIRAINDTCHPRHSSVSTKAPSDQVCDLHISGWDSCGMLSREHINHLQNWAPQTKPFLDLPGEIRNKIYTMLLDSPLLDADAYLAVQHDPEHSRVKHHGTMQIHGFLNSCKQVQEELFPLWLESRHWHLHIGTRRLEKPDFWVAESYARRGSRWMASLVHIEHRSRTTHSIDPCIKTWFARVGTMSEPRIKHISVTLHTLPTWQDLETWTIEIDSEGRPTVGMSASPVVPMAPTDPYEGWARTTNFRVYLRVMVEQMIKRSEGGGLSLADLEEIRGIFAGYSENIAPTL